MPHHCTYYWYVNSYHLVKVMSVRVLPFKITIFYIIFHKCLTGRYFETLQIIGPLSHSLHYLRIHYLRIMLLLQCLPSGDSISDIPLTLLNRNSNAVSSPSLTHSITYLEQHGLTDIYSFYRFYPIIIIIFLLNLFQARPPRAPSSSLPPYIEQIAIIRIFHIDK